MLRSSYLDKILERHNDGDSENDIRDAFRDFALRTGIIGDEREIKTEVPPATDSIKRVDMYNAQHLHRIQTKPHRQRANRTKLHPTVGRLSAGICQSRLGY